MIYRETTGMKESGMIGVITRPLTFIGTLCRKNGLHLKTSFRPGKDITGFDFIFATYVVREKIMFSVLVCPSVHMGKGRDGPYSMMHQKSRIKQRGGLRKDRMRRTGHLRLDGGPPPSPVVGMPRNVNGRLSCHCVLI